MSKALNVSCSLVSRTIAYDGRGNVTTLGNLAFAYDLSDQPIAVTGTANGIGTANGTYRYDGNLCILRVCRPRNCTDFVHFLWRFYCLNAICTKRVKSTMSDGANAKVIYNVYDAGGALSLIDKATENELIDYIAGPKADGSIDWREQYTPFGEQIQNPAANDNLDGFTGHIKDKDTGLNPCIFRNENCTVQARYYDPVIGRLLSVDPVGFLDTGDARYFNRYAYTFNDPINATDPDGERVLGINAEGQLAVGKGIKGSLEVAIDFKTGEIRASGSIGLRAGLKGKFGVSGFTEPSQKIGNQIMTKGSLIGEAGVDLKLPFLGSVEASIEGELATQRINGGLDEGVGSLTPTLTGGFGPFNHDRNGRSSIDVGAGLGASVGADLSGNINISIPDTVDAVKNLVGDIKSVF